MEYNIRVDCHQYSFDDLQEIACVVIELRGVMSEKTLTYNRMFSTLFYIVQHSQGRFVYSVRPVL